MNSPILPPDLAALPYPWHLTSDDGRSEALSKLPFNAEQRATALEAIDKCFQYRVQNHAQHGDGDPDDLPEQFYEAWIFFERGFNERMPTLTDVSVESIRRWLIEDVQPERLFGIAWETPPPGLAEAIGRFWAPGKVSTINYDLIRWLKAAIRENPHAAERAPFLELLKTIAPRLGWYAGQRLLGYVWDIGGASERDYFVEVESDATVPERTREEAIRLREIIDMESRGASAS